MDGQDLDPPLETDETYSRTYGSIGTLTSWQLLAQQVANQPDATNQLPSAGHGPAAATELQCSPRSQSWTTGQVVSPRPHHELYKEYRIMQTVGKGAFGTVSIAVRRSDAKQMVAKEIRTEQASLATAKQRAAIMGEVDVLAQLKHPNVVKYHECFMDDHYLIIIMEYCNAGDLAGLIKRQAGKLMTEEHIMFLFVQVCLALNYVHSAGILHRDLKTSNILASKPGTTAPLSPRISSQDIGSLTTNAASVAYSGLPLLKLADFGVAKAGYEYDGSMVGSTVGTPHYLSPEMCDGKRYGKKSDIWALGCILYEIACLKKAFEASNIGGIYRKIAAAEYTPVPDCFSTGLKQLISSLLSKDPSNRPTAAEALNQPFVRQHLCLYLDWVRNVPEAQPEVLLAALSRNVSRLPSFTSGRQQSQPQLQRLAEQAPAHPQANSSSSNNNVADSGNINRCGPGLGSGVMLAQTLQAAGQQMVPVAAPVPLDDTVKPSTYFSASPPSALGQSGPLAHLDAVVAAVQAAKPDRTPDRTPLQPGSTPVHNLAVPVMLTHMVTADMCVPRFARSASERSHGSATQPDVSAEAKSASHVAHAASLPATRSAAVPPLAAAKPNPFAAAAAAAAAMPSQLKLDTACAEAAVEPPARGVALELKNKENVHGTSCSLDDWASGGPDNNLIAAFRAHMYALNSGSMDSGSLSSKPSCHSSNPNTPKSPLGQYMSTWQHSGAIHEQKSESPSSMPAVEGRQQPAFNRILAAGEDLRSVSTSSDQISTWLPLAAAAGNTAAGAEQPSKGAGMFKFDSIAFVQMCPEQHQQGTNDRILGPGEPRRTFEEFAIRDPESSPVVHVVALEPRAEGRRSRSKEQPPYKSLNEWLPGESSLLQHLQQTQTTQAKNAEQNSNSSDPNKQVNAISATLHVLPPSAAASAVSNNNQSFQSNRTNVAVVAPASLPTVARALQPSWSAHKPASAGLPSGQIGDTSMTVSRGIGTLEAVPPSLGTGPVSSSTRSLLVGNEGAVVPTDTATPGAAPLEPSSSALKPAAAGLTSSNNGERIKTTTGILLESMPETATTCSASSNSQAFQTDRDDADAVIAEAARATGHLAAFQQSGSASKPAAAATDSVAADEDGALSLLMMVKQCLSSKSFTNKCTSTCAASTGPVSRVSTAATTVAATTAATSFAASMRNSNDYVPAHQELQDSTSSRCHDSVKQEQLEALTLIREFKKRFGL